MRKPKISVFWGQMGLGEIGNNLFLFGFFEQIAQFRVDPEQFAVGDDTGTESFAIRFEEFFELHVIGRSQDVSYPSVSMREIKKIAQLVFDVGNISLNSVLFG